MKQLKKIKKTSRSAPLYTPLTQLECDEHFHKIYNTFCISSFATNANFEFSITARTLPFNVNFGYTSIVYFSYTIEQNVLQLSPNYVVPL